MPSPLSDRQRDVLRAVARAIERTGRPPTGPELAATLGFTARRAYVHLRALADKGYLALEQTGVRKTLEIRLLAPARLVLRTAWPRLGAIPAGPMDYRDGVVAEPGGDGAGFADHLIGTVAEVTDLLPGMEPGDVFLDVSGDSMVDAGLVDGMTVVVRPGREARSGDICAVWVEGEGGTLKEVRFEEDADGAWVRLVPHNAMHAERRLPAEAVRVQGVLVMALSVRRF